MTIADLTKQDSISDETLAEYLKDAHLTTLLPALAYATGDLSLLRDEFRPDHNSTPLGFPFQGGLSDATQEKLRALAVETIRKIQATGQVASPPVEDVRAIFEYMVGDTTDEYFPLLVHELGIGDDVNASQWRRSEVAPDRPFTVAIIGAGLSGLAAAHRLSQAEIPFIILERNGDTGGVWEENTYPGCRLDTSNFAYSYSYAQSNAWREQYSSRSEVWGYFRKCAEDFGVYDGIRFNTEVISAVFDERDGAWDLRVNNQKGEIENLRVQAVVSAVGQLNQPNYPKIDGLESFAGPAMHTARWDHSVDLKGKRVGVIGTGASAFQVIQQMADMADSVTVFQRTAPWVVPTPGYTSNLKDGLHWLFENVPYYDHWYRVFTFWSSIDSRRPYAMVDPSWKHPLSVSEKNEELRQALLNYLNESLGDRPDLLAKMTPHYAPYSKRTLRDDGGWMETLKRPNVEVITTPIERVVEHGIVTEDGVAHEFDVLIFGTGFRASEFLSSLSVTGVGGVNLVDQWDGDSRAYYGITVPNFPNLFCLFGPNTSQNANGSIVMFSEAASDYVVDGIRLLLESGSRSMDVKWEPFNAYNDRIDAANSTMVYGAATVHSWYKNAKGRVTALWPLNCIEYWNATRAVNPDDYALT
jgi:4-hydroxyacetophenone monooxygenase